MTDDANQGTCHEPTIGASRVERRWRIEQAKITNLGTELSYPGPVAFEQLDAIVSEYAAKWGVAKGDIRVATAKTHPPRAEFILSATRPATEAEYKKRLAYMDRMDKWRAKNERRRMERLERLGVFDDDKPL